MPTETKNPTLSGDIDLLVQLARRKMLKEMPKEMGQATIEPMSEKESQEYGSGIGAYTDAMNRVRYNPNMNRIGYLSGNPEEGMADLLAHELTHVRQNARPENNLLRQLIQSLDPRQVPEPYYDDPYEMEAFQVMRDRAFNQHRKPNMAAFPRPSSIKFDINLAPEKPGT